MVSKRGLVWSGSPSVWLSISVAYRALLESDCFLLVRESDSWSSECLFLLNRDAEIRLFLCDCPGLLLIFFAPWDMRYRKIWWYVNGQTLLMKIRVTYNHIVMWRGVGNNEVTEDVVQIRRGNQRYFPGSRHLIPLKAHHADVTWADVCAQNTHAPWGEKKIRFAPDPRSIGMRAIEKFSIYKL